MPRVGRVVLQNHPHHVVQRGHNKQVVFSEEADYRYYLKNLKEFKDLYGVKVYGFCLVTNHTHLLLEPGETIAGLVDKDPCYLGLGTSDGDRAERYREFVQSTIPVGEWELVREALQQGQLTGNNRFANEAEAIIARLFHSWG